MIIKQLYCLFARDVTTAMLVVCFKNKRFLPSGNETLFSCKLFQKKFYCIDPQHDTNMTALSRGCKPRISEFKQLRFRNEQKAT